MHKIECKDIREGIKTDIISKKIKKAKLVTIMCDFPGNEASKVYVRNKEKFAEDCKVLTDKIIWKYPDKTISPESIKRKILEDIKTLNNDPSVHGILVQLPLFPELERYTDEIINAVDPKKDVDGFTREALVDPCTPAGIMKIFEHLEYDLTGKNVLIIGRGKTTAIPLIQIMLSKDATVTVAHSKTINVKELANKANVVISAVGKANFITGDWFEDSNTDILIDVGISRKESGGITGDFDKSCYEHVKHYTTTPGGTGILTVACLIDNLIKLKQKQEPKEK